MQIRITLTGTHRGEAEAPESLLGGEGVVKLGAYTHTLFDNIERTVVCATP